MTDQEEEVDNRKRIFGFPICIIFIISNELCERFGYFGFSGKLPRIHVYRNIINVNIYTVLFLAIKIIYLTKELSLKDWQSKNIMHGFSALGTCFPIFGAILSDSLLGNYKTIAYLSWIYAAGIGMIAIFAIPYMPHRLIFTLTGILITSFGMGIIKPSVVPFGADQFKLPEEEKKLKQYIGWFYFIINFGSTMSTILTPILRSKVHCFNQHSCYSLAFGVPAIMMILSVVVFIAGHRMYKIKKPQGNLLIKIFGCICYAIRVRCKLKRGEPRKPHWLDYASDRYNEILINNLKIVGGMMYVFIPLPLFWALYSQQNTAWILMATRMDGDIGFYTILPDQSHVANPALILILIPIFNYGIYPLLAKKNILTKPLKRMLVGAFLCVVAFIITGILQIRIEKDYPALPEKGEAQMRVYNSLPCDVTVKVLKDSKVVFDKKIYKLSMDKILLEPKNKNNTGVCQLTVPDTCQDVKTKQAEKTFSFKEKSLVGLVVLAIGDNTSIENFEDNISRHKKGLPIVKVNITGQKNDVIIMEGGGERQIFNRSKTEEREIEPGVYTIKTNTSTIGKITLKLGGVYALLISTLGTPSMNLLTVTPPNTIHMLWLLPQYFIMVVAEILFSISSIEFAYEQAPTNMKALVYAIKILTISLGQIIVVVTNQLEKVMKESMLYFVYSGMLFLDIILFWFLTRKFKYVEKHPSMTAILEADRTDKK